MLMMPKKFFQMIQNYQNMLIVVGNIVNELNRK